MEVGGKSGESAGSSRGNFSSEMLEPSLTSKLLYEDDYSLAMPSLSTNQLQSQMQLVNDTLLATWSNETEGNGTFGGMTDTEFSAVFQVSIYILYNTVFIAAVLGNVLVCYVVFSSPRMRTVTNYLIANLALGDLLMAVLCVPFSYIPVLYQYWPFGQLLCHVLSPAQAVCVFVSAYTLVALAGDRYMAILYPLKPRLRRSQAVIVIFVVWAIAIITALPIAVYTALDVEPLQGRPVCIEKWGNDQMKLYYSLALMILQYFFPLAVLVFTYTRIALAVWGKKAPGEAEDGRDQRLAKAKRKTVVMTLAVVAGYTLAWLPMNCVNLVMDLYPSVLESPYFVYIFFTCHWLAMAHTTYNPLIYAWVNSRFRSAFKATLQKIKCYSLYCPSLKTSRSRKYQYQHQHQHHHHTTSEGVTGGSNNGGSALGVGGGAKGAGGGGVVRSLNNGSAMKTGPPASSKGGCRRGGFYGGGGGGGGSVNTNTTMSSCSDHSTNSTLRSLTQNHNHLPPIWTDYFRRVAQYFRLTQKKLPAMMIKMMLTVVIVYTMSWLPFNTIIVCSDLKGEEFWAWEPIRYIYILCHWMAMSHTVCNPIIYCWMNSRFRVGFRTAVSRLPVLKRLLARRNTQDYDYRLQRIGTCTTYTFTPNGHSKLTRGSSLISNRTTYSESTYLTNNSPLTTVDRQSKVLLDRDRDRDRSLSRHSNTSLQGQGASFLVNVNANSGGGGCGCGPNCSLNGGVLSGIGGQRSVSPRLNNNGGGGGSSSSGPGQGQIQGQGHNSVFLSASSGGLNGSGSSIGSSSRRGSPSRRDSISESFM